MEKDKYKCKLCFRSFLNGRALGGHMRSHMVNLPIPPKPVELPSNTQMESDEAAEFASFPSSSSSSEAEAGEKSQNYGLRENPKRSIRLVDPEFAFTVDAGSVVILQDRESETESSKNPTRRRSKRTRKSSAFERKPNVRLSDSENLKVQKLGKTESWAEPDPVSSISDTTTEEDVAFCLMMLSEDKWTREEVENEEEERWFEETDESEEVKFSRNRTRGKYKCETCKKVFRSYQALGGHRASHKKTKISTSIYETEQEQENAGASMADKKIHECPVCFRVFSSGQALGGHKRTHVLNLAPATPAKTSATKVRVNLIDLNLPAPIDDDDISQIELSAVSDSSFIIRQPH